MSWQIKLEIFEKHKEWYNAIDLLMKIINENQNHTEAYIRIIYLIHNILLEEDYSEDEHDYYALLLKSYFHDSVNRFSDNAEYLFFVGIILHIGEWYFGMNDDLKRMEERLAFVMQKRASEIQPNNLLYKWAYVRLLNNKEEIAQNLKNEICHNPQYINYLTNRGFPGKYVLEVQLGYSKQT